MRLWIRIDSTWHIMNGWWHPTLVIEVVPGAHYVTMVCGAKIAIRPSSDVVYWQYGDDAPRPRGLLCLACMQEGGF